MDSKERKLAHSDRFVFPRITAPPARRLAATVESVSAGFPTSANEPAVVCIMSPVSTLSLSSTGIPCKGPSTMPCLRSLSALRAMFSASGFSSITELTPGPLWSSAMMRAMYSLVNPSEVSLPAAISAWSWATVASLCRFGTSGDSLFRVASFAAASGSASKAERTRVRKDGTSIVVPPGKFWRGRRSECCYPGNRLSRDSCRLFPARGRGTPYPAWRPAILVRRPRRRSCSSQTPRTLPQQLPQFARNLDQHIRRRLFQRMRSEPIRHAASPQPGIAPGQNVNRRVSNHQRLIRRKTRFLQDGPHPQRIGLLRHKAVAAIHAHKEVPQPQRLHNVARRIDRLVREHRHLPLHSIRRNSIPCHSVRWLRQPRQHFRNPLIDRGVVKLVQTVVAKKILQRLAEQSLVVRVPKRAPHQSRSAVSHIAGNDVPIQFRTPDMPQHRIYGVNQIKTRVDQCAIKIEHQQADAMRIERSQKTNHDCSE